mgnify:CR=1 FL=1
MQSASPPFSVTRDLAVVDVDVSTCPRRRSRSGKLAVMPGRLGRVDPRLERLEELSRARHGAARGYSTGSGASARASAVDGSSARARTRRPARAAAAYIAAREVDRVRERAEGDGGDPAEADREPDRRGPMPSRSACGRYSWPSPSSRRRCRSRTTPTSASAYRAEDAADRARRRAISGRGSEHGSHDQHRTSARPGRRAVRRARSRGRRRAASARAGGSRAPSSGRARPPRAARR